MTEAKTLTAPELSAPEPLERALGDLAVFLGRLCVSETLDERLEIPDAPASVCQAVASLNAFLDKLWLRSFQLSAKQEMLEKVIEIRTTEVHEILDNVSTGFLLALRDETVLDNFSRSCLTIFGTEDLKGRRLSELMGFSPTRQEHFSLCYQQIFEDVLPAEVSAAQLPAEFSLAGRTYAVRAAPIVGSDGHVAKVFFSINETTELHELEAENALRKALIEIIQQREGFAQVLEETSKAFDGARRAPSQVRLRHVLHTAKGNFACYGLTEIAALIHSIEDVAEIKLDHLDRVEQSLKDFLATYRAVLGFDYGESGESARGGELRRLRPRLEAIIGEGELADRRAALAELFETAAWVPARVLMAPLRGVFERTAERLQKAADLELLGQDVLCDPRRVGGVFASLGHLVRNSLDHGIEFPFERGPKPRRGRVVCACRDMRDAWVIELADDGRGIAVDAVAAAAVAQGKLTLLETESLAREERLALVFLDGLTTKVRPTIDSGRGVGMTAFLESVQEARGEVSVFSEPGAGTRVTVRLPKRPTAPLGKAMSPLWKATTSASPTDVPRAG